MQEILLEIRYFERGCQKALKKLTIFFFQTQFFLRDKVSENKRGLEPVPFQVTKQVQKNAFISYIFSDQIWLHNTKQF